MLDVEVDNLTKYFGDFCAVNGLSFSVEHGEVFGLLGPNGAGKSTLIRMLTTLVPPTSGSARIMGFDVLRHANDVRQCIGVIPQAMTSDLDLSADENMRIFAKLYGIPREKRRRTIAELLDAVDLAQWADKPVKMFSGGMRRRLEIARGLVHEPKIFFLDEPTTGLDPQNRHALWDYLRGLNDDGVTVFLTTQYLEEADELAHRLAIIDHGKIVAEGTPQELKGQIGGDAITVTLPSSESDERVQQVSALLGEFAGVGDVAVVDHSVTMYVADGGSRIAEVVRTLDAAAIPVARFELAEPTLDEVFLRHTGERLRVEEVKQQRRIGPRRRRS
jgi:ABC-2 type transport system ATP-binding protein